MMSRMHIKNEPEKEIRKHYIDNLRNLAILLLFPVHTFMIWNNFGSRFYIWQYADTFYPGRNECAICIRKKNK